MNDFTTQLSNDLVNYSFVESPYYNSATVLALSWEEDDLGVIREIRQLSTLFRELLNFEFRRFIIPSERSQAILSRAISDFVYEFGGEGNLIIIYYGGHGDPDLDGDRQSVWAA
jgi:hypothetical protein